MFYIKFILNLLIIYANCQTTEFCDNTTCATTEIDETTIFDGTTEKITTAKPTATSPTLLQEPSYKIDSECLCDLTSEKCDINCCCDPDCSESDQTVFSHCSPDSVKPIKHSGLCFSQQFIYKNNTRYKIKKNEKGLFCIAQDNYPERLQFVSQKVITSLEKFKKVWKRKRHFTWSQTEFQEITFDNSQNYKYGSVLWKYDNITNELNTINLPIQTISTFCSSTREIKYLENIETECLRNPQIENCETLDYLNAQYYCDNLKLISKPTLFNYSNPEDISLVEVRPILCDKLENCLEVSSLPNPIYDNTSKICKNVLQSVFFQLYHNGSNGILDGECVIKIENINNIIKQSFKVEYKWMRNDTNVFYRSGTPGYLEGKPIIIGKYNEEMKKILIMSKNPKEWLKMAKSDMNGNCNGNISILYGENLKTNCFFNFDKDKLKNCQDLNNEVWMILIGEAKVNNSDNQKLDIYISSYGDPSNNWVPLHIENTNMDYLKPEHKCKKIINGVHYQILYSYFGPFSSPQAKIIGVTVSFSTDTYKCESNCRLKLKSSVNYIDVSQNAVNKFAKAPVVKIKLPQDFFYPFSSVCVRITYTPLLLVTIIVYHLF